MTKVKTRKKADPKRRVIKPGPNPLPEIKINRNEPERIAEMSFIKTLNASLQEKDWFEKNWLTMLATLLALYCGSEIMLILELTGVIR